MSDFDEDESALKYENHEEDDSFSIDSIISGEELHTFSFSQAAENEDMGTEYCCLDFETSGFGKRNRVIEIGAAIIRNRDIIEKHTTLCSPFPNFRFPKVITEITKITPSMLAGPDVPNSEQAMRRLREFIGDRIVIAHNAKFDWGFLVQEFERYGIEIPRTLPICTCVLAKELMPGLASYKLGALAEAIDFQKPPGFEFHRAMSDVYVTCDLWFHLQDLALERKFDLEAAGTIKPPKDSKSKKQPKDSKSKKQEKGAIGGGGAKLSVAEQKDRAKAYADQVFANPVPISEEPKVVEEGDELSQPLKTLSVHIDAKHAESIVPSGLVVCARNRITKANEPWRDSYALYSSGMSFLEVVEQHPRHLATSTIFGHLCSAYSCGNPVDLRRLSRDTRDCYPAPTVDECEMFFEACKQLDIDPENDDKWFLKPLMDHIHSNFSTYDQALKSMWYSKVKWYKLLTFHGSVPSPEDP